MDENKEQIDTSKVEADEKQKQINQMLQAMCQRAYLNGLSAGMKTMCGSILKKMQENSRLNPAKQLILLRKWCNKNLATHDQFEDAAKKEQAIDSESETED